MIELPPGLSPVEKTSALAAGPFVVERTSIDGTLYEIGFNLTRADDQLVRWTTDHLHSVTPAAPLTVSNGAIRFTQQQDGASYVIRPLDAGDGAIVGIPDLAFTPATDAEAKESTDAVAQILWGQFHSEAPVVRMGENNLYLTRSKSGEPLALVKMSASHPTLVRQDSEWRLLGDQDDLLGNNDVPVREDAVTAWDAGDVKKLTTLVSDDRFSPADATNLWVELDETDQVQRLLLQRSRDRVYSRQNGMWVNAQPDDAATTVDVAWSAIGAWDDGDLKQLAQVQDYDTEGEAA